MDSLPPSSTDLDPRMKLDDYRSPHTFSHKLARLLWMLVHACLFRPTPWLLWGFRGALLKLFGAKIVYIRIKGSATVWAPWRLKAGYHVSIDEGVKLFNPYGIEAGDRVIISQGAFLCTASHDYNDPLFPLTGAPIILEDDCWIAAEAFIGPGVRIGRGAVVAARAVVTKDVPPWTVVAGNPAREVRKREVRPSAD